VTGRYYRVKVTLVIETNALGKFCKRNKIGLDVYCECLSRA